MDLLAGQALRQLRAEIVRKLDDRGLFTAARKAPPSGPPAGPPPDPEKVDRFLQEEMAARRLRQRRLDRQNLAWVVAGMLLPLLLVVLKFLFF